MRSQPCRWLGSYRTQARDAKDPEGPHPLFPASIFLFEPGVNSLRIAPLTADSLFGGRIHAGPGLCFSNKKQLWLAPRGSLASSC
ncbi:hypothetical protein DPMN_060609 [Dreissena polymorpha]|uniref:Uncharacterized protein n=1 Tax=Dreissena polymorpha TaxID=45954 RepID=A0A9D4HHQ1_DREPO|nr:hypothetical protein DPMN_060609 [Dreissena polymorpha]